LIFEECRTLIIAAMAKIYLCNFKLEPASDELSKGRIDILAPADEAVSINIRTTSIGTDRILTILAALMSIGRGQGLL